ncbi:MAG: GMP/IMP nucleotidase [Woeseia sp.]
MKIDPKEALAHCDTLMLDMDGTVLDLAFDNYVWNELVPEEFARVSGLGREAARTYLFSEYRNVQGQLDWYCLDHWSEKLGLDILALHRSVIERIGYLPGARKFLEAVSAREVRLLLVTNSHRDTLAVKTEVTGIADFFDSVYTSHDVGAAKEDQSFWQALRQAESFDPKRTLFVDDNDQVLHSARKFGVQMLLTITRPDTTAPHKADSDFAAVEGVVELL